MLWDFFNVHVIRAAIISHGPIEMKINVTEVLKDEMSSNTRSSGGSGAPLGQMQRSKSSRAAPGLSLFPLPVAKYKFAREVLHSFGVQ